MSNIIQSPFYLTINFTPSIFSSANVFAVPIAINSSSVNFPCSSIDLITSLYTFVISFSSYLYFPVSSSCSFTLSNPFLIAIAILEPLKSTFCPFLFTTLNAFCPKMIFVEFVAV